VVPNPHNAVHQAWQKNVKKQEYFVFSRRNKVHRIIRSQWKVKKLKTKFFSSLLDKISTITSKFQQTVENVVIAGQDG